MKPSLAFNARTRLARWGMDQGRAFAALVAPWVAMPGDRTMSFIVLVAVLIIFATGLATISVGGVLAIRELLPVQRHEAQP